MVVNTEGCADVSGGDGHQHCKIKKKKKYTCGVCTQKHPEVPHAVGDVVVLVAVDVDRWWWWCWPLILGM